MKLMKIDVDAAKKDLKMRQERAVIEKKHPRKKYVRCKRLIIDMDLDNVTTDKLIHIVIDALGV